MMTRLDIARRRLASQHLAEPVFREPGEVVRSLGAVQAQDYYDEYFIGFKDRTAIL